MHELINKYSNFLIDLDNTIYLETDYLFEAYKQIALFIESRTGLNYFIYEEFLINEFNSNNRTDIFNKTIRKFSLDKDFLTYFLQILRTLKLERKLEMFPETFHFIQLLQVNNKSIYVVTNGNVNQQKNKVDQINWKGLKSKIQFVYANEYEPKPSKKSFLKIFKNHTFYNEYLMIGDSSVDQDYAKNCEIDFFHVDNLKIISL